MDVIPLLALPIRGSIGELVRKPVWKNMLFLLPYIELTTAACLLESNEFSRSVMPSALHSL